MNFKEFDILQDQNVKDIATTFLYIGAFLIFVLCFLSIMYFFYLYR